MDDHRRRLGELIREGRRARNETQEALAERLGVTQVSVSGWESGRQIPALGALLDLCELLELDKATVLDLAGNASRAAVSA